MDRIVREISDSRDMLDYPRYSESLVSFNFLLLIAP